MLFCTSTTGGYGAPQRTSFSTQREGAFAASAVREALDWEQLKAKQPRRNVELLIALSGKENRKKKLHALLIVVALRGHRLHSWNLGLWMMLDPMHKGAQRLVVSKR